MSGRSGRPEAGGPPRGGAVEAPKAQGAGRTSRRARAGARGSPRAGGAAERALREAVVAEARALDAAGLNRGASGNLSARLGDHMLVTPSGVVPGDLAPDLLALMALGPEGADGAWEGPLAPSSEWRLHRDLMRARPETRAIVHAHAPWSTVLAAARRPIPAVHYMITAFGGPEIRCARYACFGTAALSEAVVEAMEGRTGCLMANHGMLAAGPDMARAAWLARELEALAHQYAHALMIGGAAILSPEEVAEAAEAFEGYGPRAGR